MNKIDRINKNGNGISQSKLESVSQMMQYNNIIRSIKLIKRVV